MNVDSIFADVARRDWERDVQGTPLRIAVVGLGWFGHDVGLPAIVDSAYCEATVAVSGSKGKAERVAAENDMEAGITYEEYHDGDAVEEYDAVYVVTPNALHLPYVETAASLGKHVLCEKPLEASYERARKLVDACSEADVRLMTAYRMQTTPVVRRMKELIKEGVIGDPVRAEGSFTFRKLDSGDPDEWRLDSDLAGGGALFDIGVYPLNTIRFVLDEEPTAVRGHEVSIHEGFEDVDEHVSFQLEFRGGATAGCHASYNAYPQNRLRVIGTDGRVELDPVFGVQVDRTLEIESVDGRATVGDDTDEMREEFDYFATGVLSDGPLEPDGDDGLRDMAIVDAIYASHEEGELIEL